ncbi:3-dehydroquinate synthase [Ihubacter massiliensis]|uniref:3-dehydroquinate synthase n=1 Tax=Hominibacterium faecale TaxID=2839743 RepID=A0A9J6QRF9_9FIRM|nr:MULTISPECIES: 3-dehydroquinate synthase [Eubacteriales Family XIII. Incertae Sedis]MCO7122785.1 3-dehydroquinate synthase [Ihubacter massiliensis]MCU7377059.1 3-dehydroquinate synthase [Hominibacterium faecale]
MDTIQITASKTYQVLTGQGLLCQAGKLISAALPGKARKLCIVADDTVDRLYSKALAESLLKAGYETVKFTFPPGEASKSLDTVSHLLEFLAESQLTRSDGIVALGGGITGDLAGFAAAVYLRGIDFVQVPTTLLAAVDSSVGGKTGVNLTSGKNLAGAFWQPSLVLFDIDTMKTLSYDLLLDGAAEAIKAGAIADKELFAYIQQAPRLDAPETIRHLSQRAIEIKRQVVEADERDTGVRQLLNFGHTIGHAIERCSDFSISHGHAVAIGMVICSRASLALEWSKEDCLRPILSSLKKFSFPLECPYTAQELTAAALNDKKRMGDKITLVVPLTLGNCTLKTIPVTQLEEFIKAGLS